MTLYRIYYANDEGGHYQWWQTEPDAMVAYQHFKKDDENHTVREPERLVMARQNNPDGVMWFLNVYCDEGHA